MVADFETTIPKGRSLLLPPLLKSATSGSSSLWQQTYQPQRLESAGVVSWSQKALTYRSVLRWLVCGC